MAPAGFLMSPIGIIRSELSNRESAPYQGNEGAPEAWLEIDPVFLEGLDNILVGNEIILITWFHRARRDILKLHPRREVEAPLKGVFSTRSPDRPNPLGLHRVLVLEIVRNKYRVGPLEAIDGTSIVDIKPVLPQVVDS